MPRKPLARKSPAKIQIRRVRLDDLSPDVRAAVEEGLAESSRPADVPVIPGRRKGFKVMTTPQAMEGLKEIPPELLSLIVGAITDHAAAEKRRKTTRSKVKRAK